MKWLNDYRMRLMFVGFVATIVLGGGSVRADFTFGESVNLGSPISTERGDGCPRFTADGLSMFIESDRGGP